MPFGLTNAAVFQKMMNVVLGSLRYGVALAYMDDILTPLRDFKEGLDHLRKVFQVLREARLTLRLSKCVFMTETINYLGFEIGTTGLRPGECKVKAVIDFPTLKNVHEVRQFIGLASYFRRFLKNFAALAEPLTRVLKNNTSWRWTEQQDSAFSFLKVCLQERPILALYNHEAPTEVHTDASKKGLGGCRCSAS